MALEKLAGIEGLDSDKELLSWLESEGEKTEIQGSTDKGKQNEERTNRAEEEEMKRQEENNEMEGMCEGNQSRAL